MSKCPFAEKPHEHDPRTDQPSSSARPGRRAWHGSAWQGLVLASQALSLSLTPALLWQAMHEQSTSMRAPLHERQQVFEMPTMQDRRDALVTLPLGHLLPDLRGLCSSVRRRQCSACRVSRCLCVFRHLVRVEQAT